MSEMPNMPPKITTASQQNNPQQTNEVETTKSNNYITPETTDETTEFSKSKSNTSQDKTKKYYEIYLEISQNTQQPDRPPLNTNEEFFERWGS
jgi:hypothetical protein